MLWFLVALIRDLWARFSSGEQRYLAASALASVVALLTAGLFEYNFGDSEVLMLFLIVVTLPAVVTWSCPSPGQRSRPRGSPPKRDRSSNSAAGC